VPSRRIGVPPPPSSSSSSVGGASDIRARQRCWRAGRSSSWGGVGLPFLFFLPPSCGEDKGEPIVPIVFPSPHGEDDGNGEKRPPSLPVAETENRRETRGREEAEEEEEEEEEEEKRRSASAMEEKGDAVESGVAAANDTAAVAVEHRGDEEAVAVVRRRRGKSSGGAAKAETKDDQRNGHRPSKGTRSLCWTSSATESRDCEVEEEPASSLLPFRLGVRALSSEPPRGSSCRDVVVVVVVPEIEKGCGSGVRFSFLLPLPEKKERSERPKNDAPRGASRVACGLLLSPLPWRSGNDEEEPGEGERHAREWGKEGVVEWETNGASLRPCGTDPLPPSSASSFSLFFFTVVAPWISAPPLLGGERPSRDPFTACGSVPHRFADTCSFALASSSSSSASLLPLRGSLSTDPSKHSSSCNGYGTPASVRRKEG